MGGEVCGEKVYISKYKEIPVKKAADSFWLCVPKRAYIWWWTQWKETTFDVSAVKKVDAWASGSIKKTSEQACEAGWVSYLLKSSSDNVGSFLS